MTTTKYDSLKVIPVFPLILGFYPVLQLWVYNIAQIPSEAITRSAIFSLAVFIAIALVSLLLFRNLLKAAYFSGIALVLFYAYGHIYNLLLGQGGIGGLLAHHSILLAVWGVILVGALIWLWRAKNIAPALTTMINLICAALLLIAGGQYVSYQIADGNQNYQVKLADVVSTAGSDSASQARDIYFIVVDSYPRSDILARKYGYDNQEFLDALTDIGFTVQSCAQSNYSTTILSVASALNMDYTNALGLKDTAINSDEQLIAEYGEYLRHSLVRQKLEAAGYKTVAFASKAHWLNMKDAAYYFDADENIAVDDMQSTDNFHQVFLKNSLIRAFLDTGLLYKLPLDQLPRSLVRYVDPVVNVNDSRYREYELSRYTLNKLREIPDIPGKKVTFAHLMVTHSSFVFNSDGSFREDPEDSTEAFLTQVTYLNEQLLDILETILVKSKEPPIIAILADHAIVGGPDRVKILMALYMPDMPKEKIYPTMTAVNIFRLIFDNYFGEDLPLLEDVSRYDNGVSDKSEIVPQDCP